MPDKPLIDDDKYALGYIIGVGLAMLAFIGIVSLLVH